MFPVGRIFSILENSHSLLQSGHADLVFSLRSKQQAAGPVGQCREQVWFTKPLATAKQAGSQHAMRASCALCTVTAYLICLQE